jgi:hypothetical protein
MTIKINITVDDKWYATLHSFDELVEGVITDRKPNRIPVTKEEAENSRKELLEKALTALTNVGFQCFI